MTFWIITYELQDVLKDTSFHNVGIQFSVTNLLTNILSQCNLLN